MEKTLEEKKELASAIAALKRIPGCRLHPGLQRGGKLLVRGMSVLRLSTDDESMPKSRSHKKFPG